MAFVHYDFSNVPSDGPHKKMHSRNCCICVAFLHCAFSNVPSDGLHKKMPKPGLELHYSSSFVLEESEEKLKNNFKKKSLRKKFDCAQNIQPN